MTDPASPAPASPSPAPDPRRRARRGLILFVIGAALLAAALWTVLRQGDLLQNAWDSARQAPRWLVAAMILLPILNWWNSAAVFLILTRRYGRVGVGEMTALIGSAWLLNNLPMRPGMVGRIAYHRAVNGIPIKDSVRVLVLAAASTGVGALLVLMTVGLSLLLRAAVPPGAATDALALGGPVALVLVILTVTVLRRGRAGRGAPGAAAPDSLAWRIQTAVLLRYVDVLIWGVRYALAFRLVGLPIGAEGALVVAAASQTAMLVPIQFGVREWIVGLAASLLPPGLREGAWQAAPLPPERSESPGVGSIVAGAAPGLMADLLNRAAELAVALPVGVISTAWLASRRRVAHTPPPSPDGV